MADNRGFWISELSRVYERSTEAIDSNNTDITGELIRNFNESLEYLKDSDLENRIIKSTDGVPPTRYLDFDGDDSKLEVLNRVRNRSERIAQSLDIELENSDIEAKEEETKRNFSVNIDNSHSINQSMTAEMEVSNQIETGIWNQPIKNELQNNKSEYWRELNKDEPDESKLRRILEKVSDHSTDIAAKMAVEALKKGFVAVLSL